MGCVCCVTCHNFYLCQLMPHSFNALFQFPRKTVNKMCVSHAWSPPSSDPPFLSIVGLLVCPRIDVILRRLLQRFSFSFCWLCQFLLLPLSSILPPLNHIPWQAGRMDAVSARGGGILGSAASFGYFCRRFRPNFAGRGICLTSFSNVLLRFSFFFHY